MGQMKPRMSVEYKGGATVVTFTEEKILDEADIQALAESIFAILEEAGELNLILDFGNVNFMSSAVLGLLIRVAKKAYERGGQLSLCGINERIYQVFEITGLNKIFDIFQDADQALRGSSAEA